MEEKTSRYVVRPPRDLSSQFERRQVAKAQAEEERKRKEAEDANAAVCVDYRPSQAAMKGSLYIVHLVCTD